MLSDGYFQATQLCQCTIGPMFCKKEVNETDIYKTVFACSVSFLFSCVMLEPISRKLH